MSSTRKIEAWQPVVGYEGLYSVSSFGRVRSEERWVGGKAGSVKLLRQKIIRSKGVYPRVSLAREGVNQTRYIHALVAEAFLGPRPCGMEVLHADGGKQNPRLDNLRYGTSLENSEDAKRHGTFRKGINHQNAKLSEEQVVELRALRGDVKGWAERNGVSYGHAYNIRYGVRR